MLPYGRKTPLPFPHFAAVTCRQSAPGPQGKGEKIRGWKPQVSTLLCPRRVGALPAEVQRKTSRPLGANTPAAVRAPRSAGAEKKPPVRGRTRLRSSRPPVSRCRKNRLRGSHSLGCPYTTKTKKAPLTRCLSLLRICQPLSSSSCRNYRSRRRYYHHRYHRYRRNRSRRCPDRSIPRSG